MTRKRGLREKVADNVSCSAEKGKSTMPKGVARYRSQKGSSALLGRAALPNGEQVSAHVKNLTGG